MQIKTVTKGQKTGSNTYKVTKTVKDQHGKTLARTETKLRWK